MPKKKTYEQLERALKRALQLVSRGSRAYESLNNHSKAQQDTIFEAARKLEAETFRADNAVSNVDELERISASIEIETLTDRAHAAELNLIYYRKALEASNRVSLGLLDIAAPGRHHGTPPQGRDGVTIDEPDPSERRSCLEDDA